MLHFRRLISIIQARHFSKVFFERGTHLHNYISKKFYVKQLVESVLKFDWSVNEFDIGCPMRKIYSRPLEQKIHTEL